METAIKLISQYPETKKEIEKSADEVLDLIFENEVSLELIVSYLKKAVLFTERILSNEELKEKMNSFLLDNGGEYTFNNVLFKAMETGTSYNYSVCGDVDYEIICSELNKWADKKKERETFLKTITPNVEVYGSDGVRLMPPIKKSTSSYSAKIK